MEILPLHVGKIVLVDRYVYRIVQGMARDLDPDWLEVLCAVAPRPDLVFLFHDEETVQGHPPRPGDDRPVRGRAWISA